MTDTLSELQQKLKICLGFSLNLIIFTSIPLHAFREDIQSALLQMQRVYVEQTVFEVEGEMVNVRSISNPEPRLSLVNNAYISNLITEEDEDDEDYRRIDADFDAEDELEVEEDEDDREYDAIDAEFDAEDKLNDKNMI